MESDADCDGNTDSRAKQTALAEPPIINGQRWLDCAFACSRAAAKLEEAAGSGPLASALAFAFALSVPASGVWPARPDGHNQFGSGVMDVEPASCARDLLARAAAAASTRSSVRRRSSLASAASA